MMSRLTTVVAVIAVLVVAGFAGCGGSGDCLSPVGLPVTPPVPPAYEYTIIAIVPTYEGTTKITAGADGSIHLQPNRIISFALVAKDGTMMPADYNYEIVGQTPYYKQSWRLEHPGQYTVIARGITPAVLATGNIVVDPVNLSQVTFDLTQGLTGSWASDDAYWDSKGFHIALGTKFVFEARFYNSLVPGLWTMPGKVDLVVGVPGDGIIVPDGSGYKAAKVGTTTVVGTARVKLNDGREVTFSDTDTVFVFKKD